MKKRMNLKGRRFGRLLVLKRSTDSVSDSGFTMAMWLCLCDCGNEKTVRQQKLLQGTTKSCGCIRKEKAKKWASKLNLVVDVEKYIKDRVSINPDTGCWEWVGSFFSNGYARAGLKGYSKRASRLCYSYFVGEIPKNMFACHKCDNPGCVNPDHIFIGTAKDNLLDMSNKGRSLRGEKSPNAKLTEDKVIKIRNSKKPKEYWSKKYNVSIFTIRDVMNGRTWKHVK